MSEKLNKDWLRTVMPTATILNDDVLCAEMLTIAAAAEERGRRAGIEEAANTIRTAVDLTNRVHDLQYRNGALMALEMVRALAPRDSAPVTFNCARPKCAGQVSNAGDCCATHGAPRDSGKGAKMDAPDGPQCWCGMPSRHGSGWCGTCNLAKDRK